MGDYHQSFFKRPVFSPRPSKDALLESDISSLPDLVRFNARENPHHVFALQAEINHGGPNETSENIYNVSQITFEQLEILIRRCVSWIRNTATTLGSNGERNPVALYLESDIGLFIYLVALLSIDVPVCFKAHPKLHL